MEEVWKQIDDTNYEVSCHGVIRNKETLHPLKPSSRGGYPCVAVAKKTVYVHLMVAKAFLDWRPSLVVNHIDGNKENSKLNNLEMITTKENVKHAKDTGLHVIHRKRVGQYDLDGNLIQEFNSIREASTSTGVSDKHISSVCRGLRKTTGGYVWKHAEETPQTNRIEEPLGIEVDGYPNYIATRDGRIYSKKMRKFLIPKNNNGYCSVGLCLDGVKKDFQVHRLIARAFLPIIKGKDFVNHKNFIKHDNRVENLEWVTPRENMIHEGQRRTYETRQVVQMHKDKIRTTFDSVKDAAEKTGVDASSIVRVCKGKQKTAGGFTWRYANQ